MKILIVDLSPVLYRFIFSTSTYAQKTMKLPRQKNGLINFEEYKNIFIFKVLSNLISFKKKFKVDQIVIAVDSKPYWRKTLWSGYKHGRAGSRSSDDNIIDWSATEKASEDIVKVLKKASTFKVVSVKGVEGDDVAFALSEELSNRGHEIIVKSVDHDWIYCTAYKNVTYWQTKHTAPTKSCGYVNHTMDEIIELKWDHVFYGDMGDYIVPITRYTQFSDEFLENFPDKKGKELKAWKKRHEIDMAFAEQFKDKYPTLYEKGNLSAYKHPRFGKKSHLKKLKKLGMTPEEFINSNRIHRLNFELNKIISLPEFMPSIIKKVIIKDYDDCKTDLIPGDLSKFLMDNGLFKMIGKISLF